jgi:hypothetical protein
MSFAVVNSVQGHSTGKKYFEILVNDYADGAGGRWTEAGVTRLATPSTDSPLSAGFGLTLDGYGKLEDFSVEADGGPLFGGGTGIIQGSVLQFALDFDTDPATVLVWAGVDNVWLGDPVAGTGSITPYLDVNLPPAETYYAAMSGVVGVAITVDMTLKATSAQFTYSPPDGFDPWEA